MPLYVEEMPFYEEAVERGLQRGLDQGLQRGLDQGLQRGLDQGLQRGLDQGEALTLIRILQKRLAGFSDVEVDRINGLDRAALDRLTDVVMDLNTVEELRDWLQTT
jgi:flagellar biosynthesis/type III secretory pathway protein FliH